MSHLPADLLSPRQREVLRLIAEELSNKEIAVRHARLSAGTVAGHPPAPYAEAMDEELAPFPAGVLAPTFANHRTGKEPFLLDGACGRPVMPVFYVGDWDPVSEAQLALSTCHTCLTSTAWAPCWWASASTIS